MAGQVVQAIIVPENGNLELLKEIFGNDFDKIRTDMAEQDGDGTSVIYYQAQKSAIAQLGKPVAVGSSGVKICTGKIDGESKAAATPVLAMPLEGVAATSEYPITFGCLLDDEYWRFNNLVWSAFSQTASSVEQRRQIIMTALDAFRAFLENLLTQTAEIALVVPKSAKRNEGDTEGNSYGLSDLATRFLGELKKSERRTLDEVKGLVAEKKVKEAEIETETQPDEGKSANTGGEPMSEKEFVTKEDLQAALQPLAEKAEAMTEGLESIKGIAEAVKGIQEKLSVEPEGKTAEPNADSNADTAKAASVDAAEVLKGFTDKIATLETDLTAAKSALEDQVGKINALQHAGGQHTEVEDPARKAANGEAKSVMNVVFADRGWA
jgi:hypothetical protein